MKLIEAFDKVPKELYGCYASVKEGNNNIIGGVFASIRHFNDAANYEIINEEKPFFVYDGFYKQIEFKVRMIK